MVLMTLASGVLRGRRGRWSVMEGASVFKYPEKFGFEWPGYHR